MEYLRDLPDYALRCFRRVDFLLGGVLAILYFFLADSLGIAHYKTAITFSIVTISIAEAGYRIFREELLMRRARESVLEITAKVGSFSLNAPDPGPNKSSFRAHVFWEIWVTQDVATDKFGLNLIHLYDKPWWQCWWLWKKTRIPYRGIAQKSTGSTEHREWIHANEMMPRKGDAMFEFVGERRIPGNPHWLLELTLVTGVPKGRYSVPIQVDWGVRPATDDQSL